MNDERRQRLYRVEAIILKRRDAGEADRLVTCFSRERGKLTLLGKGIRKIASRKAGHLELFTCARLLVARGRTWDIISQAEALRVFPQLREDLVRASYSFYIAELLDRLTEEQDPQEDMFELTIDTLARLSEEADLRIPARYYELRLLDLAGYRPELFSCLGCGEPIQPALNYFHYAHGGLLCKSCGGSQPNARQVTLPAVKVLRFLQTQPYAQVRRLRLSEAVHAEVEDILSHYLICVLEQNLKSARFIRLLRQQLHRSDHTSASDTCQFAVHSARG